MLSRCPALHQNRNLTSIMAEIDLRRKRTALQDLTGIRFGRLTAVRFSRWFQLPSGYYRPMWEFRCDCGKIAECLVNNVKSGVTRSCGCLQVEITTARSTKHGDSSTKSRSRLYNIWMGIKYRCETPTCRAFKNWGGRGIRVLWKSYEEFRRDMGPTHANGLQLERIDNNGHYCKENCRWATQLEQSRNRRSNRYVTFQGEKMTVTELADRFSMNRGTVSTRIRRGESPESAIAPLILFRAHFI